MSLSLQNQSIQSQIQMSRDLATQPLNVDSSRMNSEGELAQVARQFESLFMNMMLKSMRSANRTLSEGNYLNSFESKMYEDMLDEKLSVELSGQSSLGIADLLMRQFTPDQVTPTYDIKMSKPEAQIFPSERRAAFDTKQQFIDTVLPKAQQVAKSLGIDPKFITAQAALETGWGKHVMFDGNGNNSFNLFGIKARPDWSGKSLTIESLEVSDGIAAPVKSAFKMYENYEQSLADYAKLLTEERYDAVPSSRSIEEFAAGLMKGGYATDPEYGVKLSRVFESVDQTRLAVSQ